MSRLEQTVAVVTGAASGNCRAMALRFAREGADVAIADIDATRMEETAKLVREQGRRALVLLEVPRGKVGWTPSPRGRFFGFQAVVGLLLEVRSDPQLRHRRP